MTKVLVEVLSEEGMELLETLQRLRVLRFVSVPQEPVKVDRSWAGSISLESAVKWQAHIDESKNEWDRSF